MRATILPSARRLMRSLYLVWEAAPGLTIASVVLLLASSILPVAVLYLMKLMLDTITDALQSGNISDGLQEVYTVIALAGVITLVNTLVRSGYSVVSSAHSRVVVDHVFQKLHERATRIELEFYENAAYYDLFFRAKTEAPNRLVVVLNAATGIAQSGLSLLGMSWLLLSIHWAVVPILLTALIPGMVAQLSYARRLHQLYVDSTAEDRLTQYYDWVLTDRDYAKEIRVFDLGEVFRERYKEGRHHLRRLYLRIDTQRALWDGLAQAASTIAVFGTFGLIAHQAITGRSTLGDLVLFYQAFQRGQGYLQDVLNGLTTLYENNLFLSHLYNFLDLQPRMVNAKDPASFPIPMQSGIRFESVDFRYPHATHHVLNSVSLEIGSGEVIALVGENGSGKTTLIKLLCRLYDPTNGRVTIDGRDIRQYAIADLRKAIGVIFQDYAQYDLSARENIHFGDTAKSPDDPDILAAAQRSGAHDVITALPKGYDTVLGTLFENGEELSIGQWQKIALARAFLRDSQVIVLDEPTSALDPKAEYEVFQTFRELLDGRAAILISHRMSTVRMADRIYVMDKGQVVECGSHDDLMAQNGIYATLFETQAQYYR